MSEQFAPGRNPLNAKALAVTAGSRWAQITVVDETASTNADLLADTSAPDRSVLAAEHQTSGRGRLDRHWVSPRGAGLTFSVLLRPAVPVVHWSWLPLLAGVALCDAVRAHTLVKAALKWPNDLLTGTGDDPAAFGKCGGILSQTSGDAVVVGVGLNVTTTPEELPFAGATSLMLCESRPVDRTVLLATILERIDARYSQWSAADGDAEACGLAAAYRAACATIGQAVAVTGTDGDVVHGTAVGVDSAGRLRVEVDAGAEKAEHVVGAGDVEHVRPV